MADLIPSTPATPAPDTPATPAPDTPATPAPVVPSTLAPDESPPYSIVIPIHNEAECLAGEVAELVGGLEAHGVEYELILAENGSTDDTLAIADFLGAGNPHIRVIRCPVPDYGAAMKEGMLAGRGEFIANFDIDYHDVDFLLKAGEVLTGFEAGATGEAVPGGALPGIVVGSKLVAGADDRRSAARHFISLGFTTILRVLFDPHMDDTHGMKVLRRDVVARFAPRTVRTTDLFDTELIIRARREGVIVKALPVTVEEKRKPRSSIVRRIPRTIRGLINLRIVLWREGNPGS